MKPSLPLRIVRLTLGAIMFGVGVLGVLLPGLPATPFLLLASYFLARSSPQLNERLLQSRFFGPILRDWQAQRGIRPHIKVKAVFFVAVALGVSIYLADTALLRWIIGGLGLVGVTVIYCLPNARDEATNQKTESQRF